MFGISGAQTLYNNVGHIPTSHQLQWHKAGLLKDCNSITPKLVINVNSFSGTDDQKVAAALTAARDHVRGPSGTGGMAIIYFPEDTYLLFDTIELDYPDSNIVFQGDGSDKTILRFQNLAGNSDYKCFRLSGGWWSAPVTINGDISKTDSEIEVNSLTGLSIGSWVHFYKPYYDYKDINDDIEPIIVGQISQIINIVGSTITIKDEANMSFHVNEPNESDLIIHSFNPVRNIGIENLTIERIEGEPHAGNGDYNVAITRAVNCWLRGVDSNFAARNHLTIGYSTHIEVSGCYFHEAASYGGGGNGYGVQLYGSTTNCLIENNIFRKLRHALVAAGGSNCNVWTFNYSREQYSTWNGVVYDDRDLDLHAKYPFGHLFEQNIIEQMESDDYHGENGPYNTFVRNMATERMAFFDAMKEWSSLGNLKKDNGLAYPLQHNWDFAPAVDIYGFITNYTVPVPHNVAYDQGYGSSARLEDISYYYSERPYFLLSNYTWPALGTKVSYADLTLSIPAEARWGDSKKTYILNPISHSQTTSGSLIADERWTGTINCTDDVTVPAGVTLTIDPGATVTFPDNKKLLVYGTLNAVGTSSSDIEFDCSDAGETWYGVTFESGSSGELQYCTIRNASYGAYVKQCAPSITHCTFIDNNTAFRVYMGMNLNTPFADNTLSGGTYGMYLYDPDPSCSIENCTIDGPVFYGIRTSTVDDWTEFTGNNVRHCGREGVRLYRSSPVLFDNNIYSNDEEGIFMYYDSDPCLFDGILGGNNVVAYNALWGIYMNSSSHPTLGSASGQWDEGNSYYSNGSGELYSLNSHVVDARNSWWGQAYTDTTLLRINGNFYCSPILGWMDPNPDPLGLSKSSIAEGSTESSGTLQTTAMSDSVAWRLFAKAHALQMQKKYEEAIPLYQQIIDEHTQAPEAEMAVVRLARCYKRTEQKSQGKQEIIALSDSKDSDAVAVAAELEAAEWELQDGNIDQAIAHYEGVVRAKKSRSQQALVDLWAVHFHITGDKGQQTALLKQYETWYGEDENVIDMKLAMRLISGKEARKWADEHANDKELGKGGTALGEAATPGEFALHANYPNPFNPVTRIAYDLPEASVVRLEIFNVLGQRAALLLDEGREAGRHITVWDGRTTSGAKAAAGLYFCRMTAGEFAKTIKMTLLP